MQDDGEVEGIDEIPDRKQVHQDVADVEGAGLSFSEVWISLEEEWVPKGEMS